MLYDIKAMFGWIFFITHFPSLITKNTLPVWHHHSLVLTQYFSHCLWALYLSLGAVFIFYFLVSPNPMKKKKNPDQITEPNERKRRRRKKEKKKSRSEGRRSHLVWKEKEKKEDEEMHAPNPAEKKKKKRWKQRIEWWKQSYGNRVMMVPNRLLAMGPIIFELWVMET